MKVLLVGNKVDAEISGFYIVMGKNIGTKYSCRGLCWDEHLRIPLVETTKCQWWWRLFVLPIFPQMKHTQCHLEDSYMGGGVGMLLGMPLEWAKFVPCPWWPLRVIPVPILPSSTMNSISLLHLYMIEYCWESGMNSLNFAFIQKYILIKYIGTCISSLKVEIWHTGPHKFQK